MKIVFAPSAAQDVAWFRFYYRSVFPAGDTNARSRFKAVMRVLAANPYIGRPSESHDSVRELHIARTPFTLIYRITDTRIEVLRLWDERKGAEY